MIASTGVSARVANIWQSLIYKNFFCCCFFFFFFFYKWSIHICIFVTSKQVCCFSVSTTIIFSRNDFASSVICLRLLQTLSLCARSSTRIIARTWRETTVKIRFSSFLYLTYAIRCQRNTLSLYYTTFLHLYSSSRANRASILPLHPVALRIY